MSKSTNPNKLGPLVSVIIPAYNCERFVEQAVRSIMKQTYINIEIIITDDCSTDDTYLILQKLAAEDNRIKLLKNEQNLKIVKTLNNMVTLAQGKYIVRMDADDISIKKRIEKQVAFMESNLDYAMCGTNAWHIDENNNKLKSSHVPLTNSDIQIYKCFSNPFYHPSVMIRADIIKELLYDENYLYAEDYELWIRILSKWKAKNLKYNLINYRVLTSSISHDTASNEKQRSVCHSIHNLFDVFLLKKISNPIVLGSLVYDLKKEKRIMHIYISMHIFISFLVFVFVETIQRLFVKMCDK